VPGARSAPTGSSYPPAGRAARIVLLFAALWALPVGLLRLWRGSGDVLVKEALFFTRAAFITFGGAYAVLSYIAHVAVNVYGWLTADQMIQGLALAESTPGPLIMVTQYVSFIGAWNQAHGLGPLASGVLGALITTYVTFLFCFMFIFVGAPYVEALAGNRRLQAALVGVTSACSPRAAASTCSRWSWRSHRSPRSCGSGCRFSISSLPAHWSGWPGRS